MELKNKTAEKISFVVSIKPSLANAIRRSVNDIPVLAIEEVDIYKNDSVLYDEVIAHRLGLLPLKNQKIKKGQKIEMRLKVKGKKEGSEIFASELSGDVVYPNTPLILLSEGQSLELVARAGIGIGVEHAKFSPGVMFYKHLQKIKILGEGFKQTHLAEIYNKTFDLDASGKLKIKDANAMDLDNDDFKDYPGINVELGEDLVFEIESWGQMDAKEIFVEACKALKENLLEVSKELK